MRLLGSLTRHFQALLALAGLEGRAEGALLYVRLAIVLGAALFLRRVWIRLYAAFSWPSPFDRLLMWTGCGSLGFAVLHLLAAVIGGLYVEKHLSHTGLSAALPRKSERTSPPCAAPRLPRHDERRQPPPGNCRQPPRHRSDVAMLRAELDFVTKTKRAVVERPLPWLGGAALVG